MVILYILLIAYILAVNFYAFLLVKSLRDEERKEEIEQTVNPPAPQTTPNPKRYMGKLLITGLLGGAITIYACIFIFKWKRTELLLMLLMPLIGVLNIYLWVLLFRSGFRFFVIG
ncbi:MAG: hypothetical protein IJB34_03355 [Clostridia bacterium]|nr:hypothetical protein [Clostridia bacterium]